MPDRRVENAVRVLEACIGRDATLTERTAALGVLRKLPAGVPAKLVVSAWKWVVTYPTAYHTIRKIPAEYTQVVLGALADWESPAATFLVTATKTDATPRGLQAANRAFGELCNLPAPYSPSGRRRALDVLRQRQYSAAVRTTLTEHWRHPSPAVPTKAEARGMHSVLFGPIRGGRCVCGGWRQEALPFFRALVFDGGPEAVETVRPIFVAANKLADVRTLMAGFARFARSEEMKALFVFHRSAAKSA